MRFYDFSSLANEFSLVITEIDIIFSSFFIHAPSACQLSF